MNTSKMISLGGWSLIIFSLLYLGLQILVSTVFNYPALLHGPGLDAFPSLIAGGKLLGFLLTIFSLLPLLLIPGFLGAYYALMSVDEPTMRLSSFFAFLTTIALVFSLLHWPSFNAALAGTYSLGDAGQRGVLTSTLQSANAYYGTYIGGILASLCASIWFFTTARVMLKARDIPRWIGILGIVTAIYLFISFLSTLDLFPDIIDLIIDRIAPLDAIWLLVFGISLLLSKKAEK